MSVAPKHASHVLSAPGPAVHTVEIYVDYTCPFSAKIFNRLTEDVIPLIKSKYASKVQLIFRHQIQPWHPSSTLTHEAALAVERVSPDKFWDYSKALFEHQKEYFDLNVVNEARNDTYKRLAKLAESVGVDGGKVYDLLKIEDKGEGDGALNVGNQVTNDLKLLVRAARTIGVHVTPTVYFNGIQDNNISSGWDKNQWEEWLEKNVA